MTLLGCNTHTLQSRTWTQTFWCFLSCLINETPPWTSGGLKSSSPKSWNKWLFLFFWVSSQLLLGTLLREVFPDSHLPIIFPKHCITSKASFFTMANDTVPCFFSDSFYPFFNSAEHGPDMWSFYKCWLSENASKLSKSIQSAISNYLSNYHITQS